MPLKIIGHNSSEAFRRELAAKHIRGFYGMATDKFAAGGWDHLKCAEFLLSSGNGKVGVVQWMFDTPPDVPQAVELVKKGNAVCKKHNALSIVLVYGHPSVAVEIALASRADGIHYGWSRAHRENGDSMSLADAREQLGQSMLIGATVENAQEVGAAANYADYFGTTALFPSELRKAQGSLGWEGLRDISRAANEANKPLVAGGSVKPSDVQNIMESGASGFFAISPLYSIPWDPKDRKARGRTPKMALDEYLGQLDKVAASNGGKT